MLIEWDRLAKSLPMSNLDDAAAKLRKCPMGSAEISAK